MSITDEQTKQAATPIAIVGMGCVFPGARNLTEFWRVIREGRDCITEVPESHWKASDYLDANPKAPDMTYCARGGFLPTLDFDPTEFGIPPTILEATDTSQLISLIAAKAAMDDAGYGDDQKDFRRERVSVVVGVTGTQELVLPLSGRLGHPIWRKALADAGVTGAKADEIVARIADGYVPWQENSFPGLLGNVVAGRISNRLNLQGTNCVVDAACASSLSAIHMAMLELETGRCDMAVAGGADTLNDIFMYMCFSKTPALSPTGDARPFSDKADGTVLGEGVGYLVLKRLPDAERDGDRIYSVIRAIGTSSDGRSQSIYAPHAAGQERCLRDAYERASVDPSTIGLIEAHGTGTKVGDLTEMTSLGQVFDDARKETGWCAVGSVKSQIGHTKAAAGVAGLMKAALAIYHRTLPPTIKVDAPNPKMDLVNGAFHVSRAARPWLPNDAAPRRAGISAFGFGGSNYHAVLDEHPSAQKAVAWDGSVQIAAFAASTRAELIEQLDAWIAREGEFKKDLDQLAFAAQQARQAFDATAAERTLLVIDVEGDAVSAARAARKALQEGATPKNWRVRDAYYGTGTPSGGLAMLFPGQGSQYVNMGRDLACVFPEMLATLREAEAAYEHGADRLYEAIYPKPTFDSDVVEHEKQRLTRTDMAQPALGAIGLGMYRVLERFGVRADAVAGHSYGELPALAAAGRFDAATLFNLSRLRGRLMADGGRGAMLAVKTDRAQVERLIAERGIDLVVANHNSPQQTILSGAREQIGKAVEACKSAGFAYTPLNVAGAFHSPLMQAATAPFANALSSATIQPASVSVYANVTAERYGDAADHVRDLLTRQLVSPVEFVAQIERMKADGISTFVEVGPRRVLTGLVGDIVGGDVTAMALDASGGRKSGVRDLATLLCHLAAEGRPVDLRSWERPMVEPRKRRMSVALNGANLRTTPVQEIDRDAMPMGVQPQVSPQPTPISADVEPNVAPTATKPVASRSAHAAAKDREIRPGGSYTVAANTSAKRPDVHQYSSSAPQRHASDTLPNKPSTQSSTSGVSSSNQPRNHQPMTSHHESPAESPQDNVPNHALSDAIRLVQQGIAAMQDLQRQTAESHQRFLDGQEQAQRSFQTLIEQQQSLLRRTPALPSGSAHPQPQIDQYTERTVTNPVPAVSRPLTPRVEHPSSSETRTPAASVPISPSTEEPFTVSEMASSAQTPSRSTLPPSAPANTAPAVASPAPSAKPDALATPTTQQAVAATSSAISRAEIEQRVTEVVCDKTGYPAEMIEMGMDIEADLGVDSIKRVEIVAALEESIPEFDGIKPDYMGQIRTLAQIVEFVEDGVGNGAAATDASVAPQGKLGREAVDVTSPAASGTHGGSISNVSMGINASHANVSAADTPASETDADTGNAKRERFVGTLMEVVADLTGYPQDMLELPMDMEADLGIDSIKRVEILAAVEGRLPEMPTVQPEYMGSLRTLAQIVDYCVGESKKTNGPDASASDHASEASAANTASTDDDDADDSQSIEDYDPRRRVVRAIPIAAPHKSALPVPTDAEIWVTDDGNGLSKALVAALEARGHAAQLVSLDPNFAPGESRVGGLLIVAPQTLAADGLWSASSESFLKNAFAMTQALGDSLLKCAADRGAVLATVSRMDGRFGLFGGDFDAVLGGLPGLPKTAMREWQQVTCRAFDVAASFGNVTDVADRLLNGLASTAPVEIGVAEDGGWVSLDVEPAHASKGQPALHAGDTLLVTGGARGVTAECALALAHEYRPRLVLLGRTNIDVDEPEWLNGLSDEREIKQAIKKDAQARGEKLTPQELKRAARQVAGRIEIRANLERMRAAGAEVHYLAVDICDAASVARTIGDLQREIGPIRGLIHGAGRIEDKLIRNKTAEQFAAVLDTKVAGLRHVLTQLELDDLRAVVMFSSVSGRCGNMGQVDYSMANEALNKIAQSLSRRLPAARVTSLNWGPWDGGMVTPALKREFENHGVDLIPLECGAQVVVDELANVDEPTVEVVIGYSFDMPTIEAKPARVAAPMRIAFERDVDITSHPVLAAHVMNDRAVLPAALMIEWMAHAATTSQPGLRFAGVDRFRMLKGVVLDGNAMRLRFAAGAAARSGDTFDVPVELRGVRADGGESLHARATIVLTSTAPTKMSFDTPTALMEGGFGFDEAELYGRLLFHGPALQPIDRVVGSSDGGLLASLTLNAVPSDWMSEPVRSDWLTQPLALDAAFQAAILWCRERRDAPSLPAALDSYRQYVERFPAQGVSVALQVTKVERHQMICNIAFVAGGQLLARMTGYQCTVDANLASAFERNRLIQSAGS